MGGDDLEANIGALFKPNRSDAEKLKSAIELAAGLIGIPGLAAAVKVAALGHGWIFDGKKTDRAIPVLLGLYERVAKLEAGQKDYLRTSEVQPVLEETLSRIGDQPDEVRRQAMQRILHKILKQPRDPVENKLFLRLADELPLPALKILEAVDGPVAPGVSTQNGLSMQSGLGDEAEFWLSYLVNQGLLDEAQLGHMQTKTYRRVLSPLGRAFADYRRG